MDLISEENRPAPSSIDAYEIEKPEIEQRPASRMLMRGKVTEMDDALLPETADEMDPRKDASKQTMYDSPYIPERLDASGGLETAGVKKQKQGDANELNNKLGEMELKANEEEADIGTGTGTTSVQDSRYRRALDSLQRRDESLKEESLKKEFLDDDKAATGYAVPEKVLPGKSIGDEMMTPDQWLEQINEMWLSGDHLAADESLKRFFNVFPEYPIEKIKLILDPQIDFMKYINILR